MHPARNYRSTFPFIWAIFSVTLLGEPAVSNKAPPGPPNVLFIAFDDLGDWIQPLDPTSPIAMPNLSRLAQRGTIFQRAYCAVPECNPSRTALLSGMRPTTTGVYQNDSDWKKALPDGVMLPRYFRQHGYLSVGAGKIFHHNSPYFHDDASFERYLPFVADRLPKEKMNNISGALAPGGKREPLAATFDWGPSPTPENEMLDTRSAAFAVEFLQQSQNKPFFLAVGFFRPHLPYFSPERFIKQYAPTEIPLPPIKKDDLADIPAGAFALTKRWARMYRGIAQSDEPGKKWREAIGAYAAGATFADEQLGRILDALNASNYRDNTIIVVWSDHGYHLGEKEHWTKFALWEKSTRVPLVIVAPGVTTAGATSPRPVSLLDLYPTLVELCNLPAKAGLEGVSLVPLLRNPVAAREQPAIMTEGRGNHAIRTDRWRYIRYANGDEELYDDAADPHEWTNLASKPQFAEVITALRPWLPKKEAEPAPEYVSATAASSDR